MVSADNLSIKLFADGADINGIMEMYANPLIQGFTTNPTLMRKVGIENYEAFGREVLGMVTDRPVSLEVFADDFDEMERQALKIATWGDNVNVKIPITNTKGETAAPLIERLSAQGVTLNVTAMMTLEQVQTVADALSSDTPAIVSVFAGRIADTGVDPIPHMAKALEILKVRPKAELLWASPREFLNLFQANDVGCHIITMTNDLLAKLGGTGKDLNQFSLETVQMFYRDASSAGYTL